MLQPFAPVPLFRTSGPCYDAIVRAPKVQCNDRIALFPTVLFFSSRVNVGIIYKYSVQIAVVCSCWIQSWFRLSISVRGHRRGLPFRFSFFLRCYHRSSPLEFSPCPPNSCSCSRPAGAQRCRPAIEGRATGHGIFLLHCTRWKTKTKHSAETYVIRVNERKHWAFVQCRLARGTRCDVLEWTTGETSPPRNTYLDEVFRRCRPWRCDSFPVRNSIKSSLVDSCKLY